MLTLGVYNTEYSENYPLPVEGFFSPPRGYCGRKIPPHGTFLWALKPQNMFKMPRREMGKKRGEKRRERGVITLYLAWGLYKEGLYSCIAYVLTWWGRIRLGLGGLGGTLTFAPSSGFYSRQGSASRSRYALRAPATPDPASIGPFCFTAFGFTRRSSTRKKVCQLRAKRHGQRARHAKRHVLGQRHALVHLLGSSPTAVFWARRRRPLHFKKM